MADNVAITAGVGTNIATDDVGGNHYQRVKLDIGGDGVSSPITSSNPLPVEISGSIPVTIASAIEVTNDAGNPLPVSGSVSISNFPASQAVTGTFWQETQPVSAASLPLPTGAATQTTLAAIEGYFKAEDAPAVSGDKGLPLLAMRQAADTTSTDTDGDYTLIKIDEEGRVKVATKPASFDLVTGNITANAQTVSCDVRRCSNVQMHMVATSLSNHNVTFEGSIDSTNGTDGAWFAIQVLRSNANTIELTSGVLAATPAYAWETSVNGLSFIRVRATAHTSGTATWKFQRGSYATEPIPAAQISGTQPISGTVTANLGATSVRAGFFAAHGVWFDDSSANLAGNATFTGTSRDLTAAVSGAGFGATTSNVQEFRVGAESDVTGTLWLEVSRDNTNWRRVKSVATTAVTGGGFYAEIVHRPSWRYARVGYTNGAGAQARFSIGSVTMGG